MTGKIVALCKRYRALLGLLALNSLLLFFAPEVGRRSVNIVWSNIVQMVSVLPPIFIFIGLLDAWVERETVIKYMGESSRTRGVAIAFIMGAASAGPLYAAFPLASVMLRKGASLFNVFVFVGAWSSMRAPMILFETANMGLKFMLIRLVGNIIGIIAIALIMEKTTPKTEKELIYKRAETM